MVLRMAQAAAVAVAADAEVEVLAVGARHHGPKERRASTAAVATHKRVHQPSRALHRGTFVRVTLLIFRLRLEVMASPWADALGTDRKPVLVELILIIAIFHLEPTHWSSSRRGRNSGTLEVF